MLATSLLSDILVIIKYSYFIFKRIFVLTHRSSEQVLKMSMDKQLQELLDSFSISDENHSEQTLKFLLITAVKLGNLAKVKELVKNGVSVNGYSDILKGHTPLTVAITENKLEVAKYLLQKCDASPFEQDAMKRLPIHYAVQEGAVDIARALLKKGSPVDSKELSGHTPLVLALHKHNPDMVLLLVEEGKASLTWCDDEGWLPIHYAVREGLVATARILLKNGSPVDVKDTKGWTPLMMVVQKENMEMVKLLIEEGKADVSCAGEKDNMPMHLAAQQGAVDIARLLLENGSPVEAKAVGGDTPLIIATTKLHKDMVEFLLKDGNASVTGYDDKQWMPIHFAAQYGAVEIAQLLLKNNSPVNPKTQKGSTPLMIAVQNKKEEVVKLLLQEKEVSLTEQMNTEYMAIHFAAMVGDVAIVEMLLDAGSPVEPRTSSGWTPYFLAEDKKHVQVMFMLLKYLAMEMKAKEAKEADNK